MAYLSTTRHSIARTGRRTSLLDLLSLYRQRRALADLDDTALSDIGLTRDEAVAEARKPIWDVPDHWVK